MPNHKQMPGQSMSFLRIVLFVFGGQIFILCFLYLLLLREGSASGVFAQTFDFGYFYDGAKAWLAGRDPYREFGFITPPPSLIIPSLLARLSLARATMVFLGCNLTLVPLSLWWYAGALRLPLRERVLFLIASALFISAQQSVCGGNMDGLMLVLLIAAFSVRRRLSGALWLAASITLKVYSIILLPVALRRRQWRFAALTILAASLLLLPFHSLWRSALHALIGRNAGYFPVSISPATLISMLQGEVGHAGSRLCLAFWVLTFSIALYRDSSRELSPHTLARYVPWMLALPALVFSYVGVLAATVLASLVATARKRPLHRAEQCIFIGFLLLGIHVERVTNVLPLTLETYLFFRTHAAVVQSFGVVLMIVGTCFSRCEEASEGELQHEAGEQTADAGHSLPGRSRQAVPAATL
jgi:hypothetical protein